MATIYSTGSHSWHPFGSDLCSTMCSDSSILTISSKAQDCSGIISRQYYSGRYENDQCNCEGRTEEDCDCEDNEKEDCNCGKRKVCGCQDRCRKGNRVKFDFSSSGKQGLWRACFDQFFPLTPLRFLALLGIALAIIGTAAAITFAVVFAGVGSGTTGSATFSTTATQSNLTHFTSSTNPVFIDVSTQLSGVSVSSISEANSLSAVPISVTSVSDVSSSGPHSAATSGFGATPVTPSSGNSGSSINPSVTTSAGQITTTTGPDASQPSISHAVTSVSSDKISSPNEDTSSSSDFTTARRFDTSALDLSSSRNPVTSERIIASSETSLFSTSDSTLSSSTSVQTTVGVSRAVIQSSPVVTTVSTVVTQGSTARQATTAATTEQNTSIRTVFPAGQYDFVRISGGDRAAFVGNLSTCIDLCNAEVKCKALDYNLAHGDCYFHPGASSSNCSPLETDIGVIHYKKVACP